MPGVSSRFAKHNPQAASRTPQTASRKPRTAKRKKTITLHIE
jgi:hypothetical protein